MGGMGGRSDGVSGAVECQKVTGALHLHFWNFIQRAHQFMTLEEIGRRIEEELLRAEDLKRFCAHLCCESYPLPDEVERRLEMIEKTWPKFHERESRDDTGDITWGEYRFGRIISQRRSPKGGHRAF